jgi:toxin ParE1/3/4
MPSPTLRFLVEALVEAEEAASYYERMRPGLGARFRQELEFKCRSIAQNPLLWNERRGGFRRANLGGFPHYVAYFVEADEILIAAIAHASRRPEYWKRRIS